jgi:hypothetical protein
MILGPLNQGLNAKKIVKNIRTYFDIDEMLEEFCLNNVRVPLNCARNQAKVSWNEKIQGIARRNPPWPSCPFLF